MTWPAVKGEGPVCMYVPAEAAQRIHDVLFSSGRPDLFTLWANLLEAEGRYDRHPEKTADDPPEV